ncbi:PREDICTED: D-aspartate oxidase isoform X2 [Calidris pugnax]|uniref:D-aspartate oxidase isoform X2 n=1 Tax=Calidris pugnax TaxID=198806 RepID=UPI00071C28C4|nr:PREDICTED: D-aspartate oxidase isoform X2 [Calidris pugnax]XP_014820134.1 PREDICTED: D-aspartate oxidase isoform X2 [Calidris pugnax]XP_014820135.1 PREDICTED: D-aspartate oxidase isoform X2 [Calidris pugnax]
MTAPKVAVVGAGVVGLSTALCITETCPSCSVTVLSDQFSPDTTSDAAAGILIPHTYPGTPTHVQKQWFKETFTYLFAISNSAEASEAGIHLVSGWQVFKNSPKEELPFWSDIVLGFRQMSKAELQKFPQHQFGQAFMTLKCDCPPYLLWLEKRLKAAGVQIYTRKVADLWELHSEYNVVVNCTGIGARQLVGDEKLFPVRGQVLKMNSDAALCQLHTCPQSGGHNIWMPASRLADTDCLASRCLKPVEINPFLLQLPSLSCQPLPTSHQPSLSSCSSPKGLARS